MNNNNEKRALIAENTIETYKHIADVQSNLQIIINDLAARALNHDKSKLEAPEVEIFGLNSQRLKDVEYGSPEYKQLLEDCKPAIEHHYSKNSHHPQFHKNGVEDMTLLDFVEMLADWVAATKRNKNGNIRKSIEINAEKFGISPQLRKILENTVAKYF